MGIAPSFLSPLVGDGAQPLDGDALRRDLTALARANGGDRTALRKAALAAIKATFQESRDKIRAGMESRVSPGLAVASCCQSRSLG